MLVLQVSPARSLNDPHATITVEHAGEVLKIICVPNSREGKTRLGFDGPRSFKIVRDDAHEKINPSGKR
jgi:hypothetical protein